MPRIEIMNGEVPSLTVDLCRGCANGLREGQPLSDDVWTDLAKTSGIDLEPLTLVGSTDVDHPLYGYEVHTCKACGIVLTGEDA